MTVTAPLTDAPPELPAEFVRRADEIVNRYPVSKRSATLPLCHHWQEQFGFISAHGVRWIAERLELQPINVLEVVTFYPMLRQAPYGKHHVKVCRTLSCALAGSAKIFDEFKKRAGVVEESHNGHTDGHAHALHSADGQFSLEFVECLASCGTAPVCMINDDLFEKVDSQEKVQACLDRCARQP